MSPGYHAVSPRITINRHRSEQENGQIPDHHIYGTLGSQSTPESCSEQATASPVPLLRHNESVSAET